MTKPVPTRVFQEAVRLLRARHVKFEFPEWLENVAEHIPSTDVRVRRDWARFLTFCRVVALCRSFRTKADKKQSTIVISFQDYCMAYELLNDAFSSTLRSVPQQSLQVARAVRRLWKRHKKPVTGLEVAKKLGWKHGVTYKCLTSAEELKLVRRVSSPSRQNNIKPYVPGRIATTFLPSPQKVLDANRKLGRKRTYISSLSGRRVVLRRNRS